MSVEAKNGIVRGTLSIKTSEEYQETSADKQIKTKAYEVSRRLLNPDDDAKAVISKHVKMHLFPALLGKEKKDKSTVYSLWDLFYNKLLNSKPEVRKEVEERVKSELFSQPAKSKKRTRGSSSGTNKTTTTSTPTSEKKAESKIKVEFTEDKYKTINDSVEQALQLTAKTQAHMTQQVSEISGIIANLQSSVSNVEHQKNNPGRFKKFYESYNLAVETLKKIKEEEVNVKKLIEQIKAVIETALKLNNTYKEYYLNLFSIKLQNEIDEISRTRSQAYLKRTVALKALSLAEIKQSKVSEINGGDEIKLIKLIELNESYYEKLEGYRTQLIEYFGSISGLRKVMSPLISEFEKDCQTSRVLESRHSEMVELWSSLLNELQVFNNDLEQFKLKIEPSDQKNGGKVNFSEKFSVLEKLSLLEQSKKDLILVTNNLQGQYIILDEKLYTKRRHTKDFKELTVNENTPYTIAQ